MAAKEFLQKHWLPIVLVLAVIIILVVVYYAVYAAGSKAGVSNAVATIPNPSNDAAYSDGERLSIGTLTKALEALMSGFGWTVLWSDYSAVTSLSQAPSRIQIGVYEQYKVDRPNTDLIKDLGSFVSVNPDFDQVRTTLIGQLKNALGII
jgi:capsule polysaccharide export protein KpsE/RkpR